MNTTHLSPVDHLPDDTRRNIARIALLIGLIAIALFIWIDGIRYAYPPLIQLLTLPYYISGLALVLALYKAVTFGYWLHAVLFGSGLIVLCGLV